MSLRRYFGGGGEIVCRKLNSNSFLSSLDDVIGPGWGTSADTSTSKAGSPVGTQCKG